MFNNKKIEAIKEQLDNVLIEFEKLKEAAKNIVNFDALYDKILDSYSNSKKLINDQLYQYDKKIIENSSVVDERLLSFQKKLDSTLNSTIDELRNNLINMSVELKNEISKLEEYIKSSVLNYVYEGRKTIEKNLIESNQKISFALDKNLQENQNKISSLVDKHENLWNENYIKHTNDINNKLNSYELNLNEMINAAISKQLNNVLIEDISNKSTDFILKAFNKSLDELDEKEKYSIIEAIKAMITPKLSMFIEKKDSSIIEPLRDDELFHDSYKKLKLCVTSGIIPMLVGPAGTGKSTAAEQLARDLGLKFYMANRIQNTFELVGFQNAAGVYQPTQFYDAYKNGGLFLFDEVDASSPEALVTINAAIAQREMAFPGHTGNIEMHKDFKAICAGNTFGTGSTLQYTGRNKLDAATLDRFMIIEWDYDKGLEEKIIKDKDLLSICWALRVACPGIDKSIIISTRGIITLEKMLIANKETKAFLVKDLFRQKFFENVSKANLKKIYNAISDECKGNFFLKYIGELSE